MKPIIWLRSGEQIWIELATDDKGSLSVSSIAARANLTVESLLLNELAANEGVSIEDVRHHYGASAGETRSSPVDVGGTAKTAGSANAAELLRAGEHFQRFVGSAAQNYKKWESGEAEQGKPNKFLEVDGHPFSPSLIYIRESYKDLKKIFTEAEQGKRYIVLGTAGIGKALFTVFWVSYLATSVDTKKVVWKFQNNEYYLLDFSLGVVRGPIQDATHADLQSVFRDPSSWLIIDGQQGHRLEHECRILLACSGRKSNYAEFGKHRKCTVYYLPVWAEAEIIGFCDDFEDHRSKFPDLHRSKFSDMHVPDKQKALALFEEVGGVPRYVLDTDNETAGLKRFHEAVSQVTSTNCIDILSGNLRDMSDCLVHRFLIEENGHMPLNGEDRMQVDKEMDYTNFEYRLASSSVHEKIIEQFNGLGHADVVAYLSAHIKSQMYGTLWGHLYELVADAILTGGGKFKKKRVHDHKDDGHKDDGDTVDFDQVKLNFVKFEKVEELGVLKDEEPSGAYCKPSSPNFESVDAVIVPDTLVQIFRYTKGNHGYKIQGLTVLDKVLGMPEYEVWSCVPREYFVATKFQNWLNKDGTKGKLPGDLGKKMHQYVVEVDFRKY